MPATASVPLSGNQDIDGILSGVRWGSGALTYSFPTSASFYGTSYSPDNEPSTFSSLNVAQQTAARTVLAMYAAVSGLTFTQVTETSTVHGTLRFAMSDAPDTAWAYYPSNDAKGVGGDVWLNKTSYNSPARGTYAFATFLHEIGHALGLKHGQEADGGFPTLPAGHDSLEYSVMTYRSYVGDPLTAGGYTVESGGYPQSLMMNDIAALQHMYGANFATNAGNTVYAWNSVTGEAFVNGVARGRPSANRVFETVWDGGGNDTYDLSNYSTNLVVSLAPGGWTTLSTAQLAHLDYYGDNTHVATGNVANALLYNGDTRSLIENAYGGSGSDSIAGNAAANVLNGGGGADTIDGGAGADTLSGGLGDDRLIGGLGDDSVDGGLGDDTAAFAGNRASYAIVLSNGQFDVTGPEGHDVLFGVEHFVFADQTVDAATFNATPTSETVVNSDGSRSVTYWDRANQSSWSDYTATYDAQGRLLSQVYNYDDGTQAGLYWDPAGEDPWTDFIYRWDAQRQLASQVLNYDDGTKAGLYWDVDRQNPWSSFMYRYDEQGRLLSQDLTYDDGTYARLHWDAADQSPWAEFTYRYDTQGRLTSQVLTYDNGSSATVYWDVDDQNAWSQLIYSYDDQGRMTKQDFDYDDGTHGSLFYDATGEREWSRSVQSIDEQRRVITDTVDYDDGRHAVYVFDVTDAGPWRFYVDTYDAGWNRLSQDGTYDDGTTWHI